MSQNFVCIASYNTAPEAHLMRGLLESAGIPAFLRNEHLVSINSFYCTAVGGVEVVVPEEYVEDALRFLHGEVGMDARPQQVKQDTPVCPHCGGTLEEQRRIWPAIVSMLLCFGSPAQVTPVRRCSSCGKKQC